MGTLSLCREVATKEVDEAIDILYNHKYHNVIIYDCDERKLRDKVRKIFDEIKKRNADIQDVNDQMLPVNPYYWNDIDGCLAVHCAEIGINTFNNSKGCLSFTGFDYTVLTDPNIKNPLGAKAISTLMMIGEMCSR